MYPTCLLAIQVNTKLATKAGSQNSRNFALLERNKRRIRGQIAWSIRSQALKRKQSVWKRRGKHSTSRFPRRSTLITKLRRANYHRKNRCAPKGRPNLDASANQQTLVTRKTCRITQERYHHRKKKNGHEQTVDTRHGASYKGTLAAPSNTITHWWRIRSRNLTIVLNPSKKNSSCRLSSNNPRLLCVTPH